MHSIPILVLADSAMLSKLWGIMKALYARRRVTSLCATNSALAMPSYNTSLPNHDLLDSFLLFKQESLLEL